MLINIKYLYSNYLYIYLFIKIIPFQYTVYIKELIFNEKEESFKICLYSFRIGFIVYVIIV